MNEPYILNHANLSSVKSNQCKCAVLPWGAIEAHNYHLPYGTDVIETEHIAEESVRRAWAPRQWDQVTADTGAGNPHAATAEKGQKYFNFICQAISEFIVQLSKTDRQAMYR